LDVLHTRQPTTEARELDAFKVYLFEPERRDEIDYRALLCMMIGDRLQHAHRVIKPALAAGRIVLCDRYIFTQMVTTRTRGYQDEPWMYELYQHVIAPDIGIITDADPVLVCERIAARSESREAFHELDHVLKNLVEFRRLAQLFDLDVVDTAELGIAEALDRSMKSVGAVLPSANGEEQPA
jgi:dTMP kinase